MAALLGGVTFFAFYDGWFSTFFLVLLLLLPIFSLLCSLPAALRFHLTLNAPTMVTVGEPAMLTIQGEAPLALPKFRLRLLLEHSITGYASMLPQRNRGPLSTKHCGQLVITASKIRCYDFLGLFWFSEKKPMILRTLVRPKPVPPVHTPSLQALQCPQLIPKPSGSFSEIHELRQYQPGDSLRSIHWKASAKTDQLIVREPMEPAQTLAVLTLDLSGTPGELDSVLGQMIWLSLYLLEREIQHEIWANTGVGLVRQKVSEQTDTYQALDRLLSSPAAEAGSMGSARIAARWRYHIIPQDA